MTAVQRMMAWVFVSQVIGGTAGAAQPVSGPARVPPEPSIAVAKKWWGPLTNMYTPVGWKNHAFRFNVFYNGVVLADPRPEHAVPALDPWLGQGVQLTIQPSEKGLDPNRWRAGTYQMTGDNGRRWNPYQGLLDTPTPVIWTEWRQSFRSGWGYAVREEVFGHIPGARPIETGTEPLFAWIRLSISNANPIVDHEPAVILVRINKPHIHPEMYEGRHCALRMTDSMYPRELNLTAMDGTDPTATLLTEPDGKVRLAVLPSNDVMNLELRQKTGNHEQDTNLLITLPVKKGAYVDLLLPMLPTDRETFAKEMSLGRDKALAEADAYWSKRPPTAATIRTPEPHINKFLRRSAQYGELIAQKMPDSGHYTNLTGSWVYARMWATPTTMFDTMLLDTLGYHQAVADYVEIFKDTQGTVKPPGPSYKLHPGYYATPKSLTSIDWLSDHGAVLHAICYHALLTDDQAFIEHWLPSILKACDFIREVRHVEGHDGVKGLLPPAVATDEGVPTQAVWNLGWHYRGLASAVRLLQRIEHPQASLYAGEADDYRRLFVDALRKQTAKMPTWTDSKGKARHIVPRSLSSGSNYVHPFYLDTGPLFLVYAGLLDADDPMMVDTLAFFREGPNWLGFDPDGHYEQPGVLVREISSCEPCASFNLFHTHQSGDRARFLEGMYSMITGAHSQQTYIACETRGGITGLNGHIGIYCARLAAIDDLVEPDELHLLRLTPLAWLKPGFETTFTNVPTVFGPVGLRFTLSDDARTLTVRHSGTYHHAPKRTLLHIPPLPSIEKVVVIGKETAAKAGDVVEVK